MSHKFPITGLLLAVLLSACLSSVETLTAIPPTPSATATTSATFSPTSTLNVSLTQIEETRTANLLEPYRASPSDDLSALHQTLGGSIIESLSFTQTAKWWSNQDRATAQEILKLGMNPGLGMRTLHAQGITGQGVKVAIIDQPVILGHPEFEGKISKYRDFGTGDQSDKGSMHGPAVTSLLAGENIGTAPDARVYYAAVPSWFYDAQYYADALDWIIAENEKLPDGEKIRVASVSSIPSGISSEYQNQDAWEAAYGRA